METGTQHEGPREDYSPVSSGFPLDQAVVSAGQRVQDVRPDKLCPTASPV